MASNIKKNINGTVAKKIWTVGMDPRISNIFWGIRCTGKRHGGNSTIRVSSKVPVVSSRPENKGPLRLLCGILKERKEPKKMGVFDSLGLDDALLKTVMSRAPRRNANKKVLSAPTTKIYNSNHSLRSGNVNVHRRQNNRCRSHINRRLQPDGDTTSKSDLNTSDKSATGFDLVDVYVKNAKERYGHLKNNLLEISEDTNEIVPKKSTCLAISYKTTTKPKPSDANVNTKLVATDTARVSDNKQIIPRSGTVALIASAPIRKSATKATSKKIVSSDKDLIILAPGLLANKRAFKKIKKSVSNNNQALSQSDPLNVVDKAQIRESATAVPSGLMTSTNTELLSVTSGLLAKKVKHKSIQKTTSRDGSVDYMAKPQASRPISSTGSDLEIAKTAVKNENQLAVSKGVKSKAKLFARKMSPGVLSSTTSLLNKIKKRMWRGRHLAHVIRSKVKNSMTNVSPGLFANEKALKKLNKSATAKSMTNLTAGLMANKIALKKITNSGTIKTQSNSYIPRTRSKLTERRMTGLVKNVKNRSSSHISGTKSNGSTAGSTKHPRLLITCNKIIYKDIKKGNLPKIPVDNTEMKANISNADLDHISESVSSLAALYAKTKANILGANTASSVKKIVTKKHNQLAVPGSKVSVIIKPQIKKNRNITSSLVSSGRKVVTKENDNFLADSHGASNITKSKSMDFVSSNHSDLSPRPKMLNMKNQVARGRPIVYYAKVKKSRSTAPSQKVSADSYSGNMTTPRTNQKMYASGCLVADDAKAGTEGCENNVNADLLTTSNKVADEKDNPPVHTRLLIEIVGPETGGSSSDN